MLKDLDVKKGSGPDSIPPIYVKRCAVALAQPLSYIFNKSLRDGIFPAQWKVANIVPVHKKGSKTATENYRPISILCIFEKIFERIVHGRIYNVIADAIPEQQHGFMRRRSTTTNLTLFNNYILKNMQKHGQVDVVYTDFEKAFDRVDHVILLKKLEHIGICGDLLRWVASYLRNRSQSVTVGGYRSDLTSISSGIPQGSLLGPLFYNAYLFDIHTCFKNSHFLMYADDTKIFLKISELNDCFRLQEDLNRLTSYYKMNRIAVNVSKCQIVSFSRSKHLRVFNYRINDCSIERSSTVRDLGILLDHKLLMDKHIDTIVDKAFKGLGFLKRVCRDFRNAACLKAIYFA